MRFTTVDPIRDGSNWFAYVNNDPVNYVDLDGLMAVTVVAGTVATVSGGTIIVLGIVTAVVVADALSDGAVSAAISNFVDNVIEKRPVRDREGNPIPPGNQSPGPLGKKQMLVLKMFQTPVNWVSRDIFPRIMVLEERLQRLLG